MIVGKKRGKGAKNQQNVYINDENDDDTENELKIYSNAREERLRKKKHRKSRLITIILLLFFAFVVYLNWDILAPATLAETLQNFFSSFGQSKYPVEFTEGSMKAEVTIGSNIGVLTDTSFILYSKNGEKLDVRPHGINDPTAVSGGGKALIYDRGGKSFRVETRFDEPFTSSASYNITTAAMGKSGNFAIVTEGDNYLSEVTVYNDSYKNIFKWDTASGRILSAALSPDGKKFAAIVVGVRDGSMFSDIYIYNLDSKTPVAVKKYDGQLLYSISFKDNKRIAAVGDEEAVFLYASGTQKSIYSYSDNELECSSNNDGPVVLVFKKSETKSGVVSLGSEGKLLGSASIAASDVTIVNNSGGRTIVVSNRQIWHAADDCSGASTIPVSVDVLTASVINDYAYVFGTQSVDRYKLS